MVEMPSYAGTNCQHLEKTSFKTAGPSFKWDFTLHGQDTNY